MPDGPREAFVPNYSCVCLVLGAALLLRFLLAIDLEEDGFPRGVGAVSWAGWRLRKEIFFTRRFVHTGQADRLALFCFAEMRKKFARGVDGRNGVFRIFVMVLALDGHSLATLVWWVLWRGGNIS